MWGNLVDAAHGWTAASYLATFIVYLGCSVVELFGWSLWVNGDNPCFYKFYVTYIGQKFITFGGITPIIFPLLQLILPNEGGGLDGNLEAEYGYNTIYLSVVNGVMWIVVSLIHIIYVPELEWEILDCEPEKEDDGEED